MTVIDDQGAHTPVASDETIARIDSLQYTLGEGPCVSAALPDAEPMAQVDDLATDRRRPRFGPAAVAFQVRSMLSFQLLTGDGVLGALNLYSSAPAAFRAESRHLGKLIAASAATTLQSSFRQSSLRAELRSRDLIGQARASARPGAIQ